VDDLLNVFLHQRNAIFHTLATQTFPFVLNLLAMSLMSNFKNSSDRKRRLDTWERNLRGDPAFRNVIHLFSDALNIGHTQLELDPEDDFEEGEKAWAFLL
jgi:hypothetical protein